jgi:acetolactate decarboxylase
VSGLASHHLREFARTMAAHRLGRQRLHHDVARGHEVFQVSTINALLEGVYDGDTTVEDLLRHGDFGVGTFDALDGEMVVLEGRCYRLRADGSVSVAAAEDRTPFAVVTFFDATAEAWVDGPLGADEVHLRAEAMMSTANVIHAVRLHGTFSAMRTRTVLAQTHPYPPLVEATANEPIVDRLDVTGTICGFRTPDYARGIGVTGYHLHFVDDDRRYGGHVLDFTLARGRLAVDTSSDLHLSLPLSASFGSADLGGDRIDEVDRSEKEP